MRKLVFFILLLLSSVSVFTAAAKEDPKVQESERLSSKVSSTTTGQTLYLQKILPGSLVEIYSLVGIKLLSIRSESSEKTIELSLPKGYYFLKVANTVKKIVIK